MTKYSKTVSALSFGLLFLASACAGTSSPALPANADDELRLGESIYASNCASCHGVSGGGGLGTKLSGGVVVANYPTAEAEIVVVNDGRNSMPGFSSRLSESEVEAVVRYTREVLSEAS